MSRTRLIMLGLAATLAAVLIASGLNRQGRDIQSPAHAAPNSGRSGALLLDTSPTPDPTATPPAATPEPGDDQPAEPPTPAEPSVPEARPEAKPVPTPTVRPAHTGPARLVDRGVTTRQSVALTFDAGADRGYAEMILDVLQQQSVRASFGMTGLWARQNPDLVQRMAAEGHQFLNHTYDHQSFTGLSTGRRAQTFEQRAWQLDTTEAIIGELTGATTLPYFRSPYGDTDSSVLRDIGARGYAYDVLWTVDSRGWMRYTAGQIIQRCLAQAVPGAIYVMHVGAQSQDGPALNAIINGLREMGYRFETVDEILQP